MNAFQPLYVSAYSSQAMLVIRFTSSKPDLKRYPDEKSFVDPKSGKRANFPSILDSSSRYLSIIVPAYNEEERCKIVVVIVIVICLCAVLVFCW